MNHDNSYRSWINSDVYDSTGSKIGSIDQIYLDDRSGQPEWMTVSTGWFGTSTQFVPIAGTSRSGDGLTVPYTTDQIKQAPSVDADGHLSEADERRLYAHYGMDFDAQDHETMYGGRERADEGYEYHHSNGDHEVTLSEEQLEVGTVEREAGAVRLRKYVVEEDVNIKVPVKKQVARIVRTPASGTSPGTITGGDEVEEVVLQQEEVTVGKQTVAKETVGIETDTITETQDVSETVRKERVEVDGDVSTR